MNKQKVKQSQKLRRKKRVKVKGTALMPRLSVFRSLKNIFAQLIDDDTKKTLVAANSKGIKVNKTEAAKEVGKILAKKAIEAGIKKIVFDKGSYRFHGRIKALADAARENGLEF